MDFALITQNLLSPPILFFVLGLAATLFQSDLEIPSEISKGLSLYLLFAIGFHGGVELARSGLGTDVVFTMIAVVVASLVIPILSYPILRFEVGPADAAAIAACYGSISAVTFITAVSFLESFSIEFSGFLVAAMALMESPAIIVGFLLARYGELDGCEGQSDSHWKEIMHEALFNGSVLLLLGSLVIGYLTGEEGWTALKPLVKDPFKGILCLFLLDMGIIAAKRLGQLKDSGFFLIGFSIVMALVYGVMGIATASLLGLIPGDALLLAILFGSASYIAVPAAMRMALPKANPSLYLPMSLGVTFPMNITIGIPIHMAIIEWWWMI